MGFGSLNNFRNLILQFTVDTALIGLKFRTLMSTFLRIKFCNTGKFPFKCLLILSIHFAICQRPHNVFVFVSLATVFCYEHSPRVESVKFFKIFQ